MAVRGHGGVGDEDRVLTLRDRAGAGGGEARLAHDVKGEAAVGGGNPLAVPPQAPAAHSLKPSRAGPLWLSPRTPMPASLRPWTPMPIPGPQGPFSTQPTASPRTPATSALPS